MSLIMSRALRLAGCGAQAEDTATAEETGSAFRYGGRNPAGSLRDRDPGRDSAGR